MRVQSSVLAVLSMVSAISLAQQSTTQQRIEKNPAVEATQIPIVFEPNRGQAAPGVRFVARSGASTLLLSDREAQFLVTVAQRQRRQVLTSRFPSSRTVPIRMVFPGAKAGAAVDGFEPLKSQTNYFFGSTKPFSAAHYRSVRFRSLYPGIDLVYHSGKAGRLEHDFVVEPGRDPRCIRMAFPGSRVSLARNGDLLARKGRARVVEKQPVIYQDTAAGRKEIVGGYRTLPHRQFGFEVGDYDRSLPLVIDPEETTEETIGSVGYLGGQEFTSVAGVAIGPNGEIYFTGQTAVTFTDQKDFPSAPGPGPNAFVIQMSPDMSAIQWVDILGGTGGQSRGLTIQVNANGEPFVAGFTNSPQFPVINPFQPNLQGQEDMVIFKLNATGTQLLSSTFLGGTGNGGEFPFASTIDPLGNFFVCGNTDSANFPFPGSSFQQTPGGSLDGTILKFDPFGRYVEGTRFGGPGADQCSALIFQDNKLWFTGIVGSTSGLPVSSNAFQPTLNGQYNAFIGVMTPDLLQVPYFTYFGGPGKTFGNSIYVSPNLDVVLSGVTNSATGFPQVSQFPTIYHGGDSDGFVAFFNFNPAFYDNPSLLQSTLIGGSQADSITDVTPLLSPGGGIAGVRLFGPTDSIFKSTLNGFPDCGAKGSMLFGDLTLLVNADPLLGCRGVGTIERALYDGLGRTIFVADVRNDVVPSTLPSFPFPTGTRGAGLFGVKTGFTSPQNLNGGIFLEQTSFLFPGVTAPNTATGELTINVPSVLGTQPFGYFNVFIDGLGWVAQNIRIDRNNGVNFLSTPVLLQDPNSPNGPILNERVKIQVTPAPVPKFNSNLPASLLPVRPVIENAHGVGPPPTAAPPPPAKDRAFGPQGDTYSHVLPHPINVAAQDSQCAPMSYANSLAYLAAQNDNFKLPHQHVPGIKGDNSLVGQLDTAMGRTVRSATDGDGLYEQPQLTGKFLYLKNNKLDGKLVNKFQGPLLNASGNGSTSDFTSSGITAKNQGEKVTFDWLCAEIQQGEDVELMYEWSTGGHAVRMFGCGKTRGAAWIEVLDDGMQTNTRNLPHNLRTRHIYVGDLTGNGDLNFDNVGRKIVSAISESFTPELKAAPGAPPSSFRDAITNGASYVVNYLTKGTIGAMFGLFQKVVGSTTEPEQAAATQSASLATDLGGTEILFNGKPIPLFFVTSQQIDFQVPADQPAGEVTVVVKQGTKQSAAFTINISDTPTPGIILIDPSIAGANRGAIQNQDSSLNLPNNPAKPGNAVIAYVTGLGDTDIPVATGQVSPNPPANYLAKVTATIGGKAADVQFAGLTPDSIALGQVNVVVPDLAPGDYPIVINADGAVSNAPLLSVGRR